MDSRTMIGFVGVVIAMIGSHLVQRPENPFPSDQQIQQPVGPQASEYAELRTTINGLAEQIQSLRSSTTDADVATAQWATLNHSLQALEHRLETRLASKLASFQDDSLDDRIAALETKLADLDARCQCGKPQTSTSLGYSSASSGSTGSVMAGGSTGTVTYLSQPARTIVRQTARAVVPARQTTTVTRSQSKLSLPIDSEVCYIDENGNRICPDSEPTEIVPTEFTSTQVMRKTSGVRVPLLRRLFGR